MKYQLIITIHKKTICSRQKYPEHLFRYYNTEFSTGHKYPILFEIHSTVQNLFEFYFKTFIFYTNFFCLSSTLPQILIIVGNFVKNHATKARCFCFYPFVNFFINRRWGAKITQNEKWRPFGGRWIKKNQDQHSWIQWKKLD